MRPEPTGLFCTDLSLCDTYTDTYFKCIPTQLSHLKSWTSFAAGGTSRVIVWPAPVIYDRSCCTSLSCFNLVMLLAVCRPPDSWSILKLRVGKGSECRYLKFPRTASGAAIDECPSAVSLSAYINR